MHLALPHLLYLGLHLEMHFLWSNCFSWFVTIGSESFTEKQQFLRISGAVSDTPNFYGVVRLGDFTLGRPYSGVP